NMKRICFVILMSFVGLATRAQDLEELQEKINAGKFKEAKAGIDKFLGSSKNANDIKGLYLKGRIYVGLSAEKETPDSTGYNLKNEAYEAFKKNQVLDAKDIWLTLEGWGSYLNLYIGFYDLGAKFFNAKNFDLAYHAFEKANEVKDYTLNKKYTYAEATLYPLDTALVLNTALAATNAKKIDEAIVFYKKLADANVAEPDHQGIYEYLVDYYSKKNDEASLKPVLEKGKKLFPNDPFWTNFELKAFSDKGDSVGLYAKYDEMLNKNPSNYDLAYGYSVELYNNLIKKDSRTPESITGSEKLQTVLKIAIAADKGIDATVLMTNHLFNTAADLLNASNLVKGTKPDDVKKRNDLKAQANARMDQTITYADAAIKYFEALPKLTPLQRANYKVMLDHLSEMYSAKGNKAKVAEYEAKNKAADKM
ncbi:MAG: hypothetical protein ABIT58_10695, partial [Ferruginibacter sp.]